MTDTYRHDYYDQSIQPALYATPSPTVLTAKSRKAKASTSEAQASDVNNQERFHLPVEQPGEVPPDEAPPDETPAED